MKTLILLLLALAACTRSPGGPTPTPTLTPLQVELEAAAAAWQALDLQNYTMNVQLRHPGWNVQTFAVQVVDGVPTVLEHDCFPERTCAVRRVDGARLTVDNVIAEARAAAAASPTALELLVYHDDYHFPRIVAAHAGETDSWQISDFRPAP